MAPKKLSEADKQAILRLYRQPAETTSTLAEQFGVSNSTISRLLKSQLPAEEYGNLIQQKRSASDKGGSSRFEATTTAPESAVSDRGSSTAPESSTVTESLSAASPSQKPLPKRRRRSRRGEAADSDQDNGTQLPLLQTKSAAPDSQAVNSKLAELEVDPADDDYMITAVLGEDADLSSDDDYDDDDDELEDDFDDEEDGEDWEANGEADKPHLQGINLVEINPLTQATLPKPCYLVVDRLSELITCPLKDFGELGQIPEAEVNARTLPVFDNHRVARRFSRRNQRVIKVPDGSMLQKTQPYLQSKGITRLLVDGQVYSLS